jgi:hypothetical protein
MCTNRCMNAHVEMCTGMEPFSWTARPAAVRCPQISQQGLLVWPHACTRPCCDLSFLSVPHLPLSLSLSLSLSTFFTWTRVRKYFYTERQAIPEKAEMIWKMIWKLLQKHRQSVIRPDKGLVSRRQRTLTTKTTNFNVQDLWTDTS